jgi:hypothetical protein
MSKSSKYSPGQNALAVGAVAAKAGKSKSSAKNSSSPVGATEITETCRHAANHPTISNRD